MLKQYLIRYPSKQGKDHVYVKLKANGQPDRTAGRAEATTWESREAVIKLATLWHEPFFTNGFGPSEVIDVRDDPLPGLPETITISCDSFSRLCLLERAVNKILDQEDDDHCWRDAYTELRSWSAVLTGSRRSCQRSR